jgi:hypothetical protein
MNALQFRPWRRSAIRFVVAGAVLLQLAACSPANRALILYQYRVGFRNLVVNLLGDVVSAALGS